MPVTKESESGKRELQLCSMIALQHLSLVLQTIVAFLHLAVAMSDSHYTRFVSLRPDSHREHSSDSNTVVSAFNRFERQGPVDHRQLFNHHQWRIAQIVNSYQRPGVVVVAMHPEHGLVGHLWLESTRQLRAATIGRHSAVDLFLPHDEALSLRHLLLMVRQISGTPFLHVAELATAAGFRTEDGGPLSAIQGNAPVLLSAASYSLLIVGTGGELPWQRDAANPWSTLPQRRVITEHRGDSRPLRPLQQRHDDVTICAVSGPHLLKWKATLQPQEAVEGHLIVGELRLPVGARALQRGLILGRSERCDGQPTSMGHEISRVHAVIIRVDGCVHLIDAGSTNGVFQGDLEVKCTPMVSSRQYTFVDTALRWEPR